MKAQWITPALTITMTMSFVLTLIGIDVQNLCGLRVLQTIQKMESTGHSAVPDNLASSAEGFMYQLHDEIPRFPVDQIAQSSAWKKLQGELSGYAARLKLMDAQEQELDRRLTRRKLWMGYLSLSCILVCLVLSVLRMRGLRLPAPEPNQLLQRTAG